MTFSFKKISLILKISMIFLIKEFKYFGNQNYLFIYSFIHLLWPISVLGQFHMRTSKTPKIRIELDNYL
jgi:hypothetical protein